MWMFSPSTYIDHGPLGLATLSLLLCVSVLYRTLRFAREILGMVFDRLQDNTETLTQLAERLRRFEEDY